MNKTQKFWCLALCIGFVNACAGVGRINQVFIDPAPSAQQALELVEGHLRTVNIRVEKYSLYSASYDYIHGEWSFFFNSKQLTVGSDFLISVTDHKPYKFKITGGA